MRMWSLLYATSLLVSSVAAGTIASGIYRHSELRVSAVRFVIFFFFVYLWLWSLFRGIFHVDLLLMSDATLEDQFQGVASQADFDALGLRGIAQISNVTRPWMSFILVMGDTALMGSSLWMFPMTWELSKLARKSMDRGAMRERETARFYCKCVHVLIVIFFLAESAYTVYNHGFNTRSYRILISGNMIQAILLLYVVYVLISLKCSGRKYEAIHGAHVLSPLYKRIKGIMIVYGIFSFQYQIISLILLFSRYQIHMPNVVIGVSTLLFNNSGTALTIVMGCSQECFVRSFGKYLPEEYTHAFYVAEPSLEISLVAAANYAPPLVNPVFVFTDIESSSQLWGLQDGQIMRQANELHDEIMRSLLAKFHGYEITTCGDAFQLAFHTIKDAVDYCMEVQFQLLEAKWPKKLHDLVPATARVKGKGKEMVFNGLRVRMGVHDAQESEGVLVKNIHPVTGKITYIGISEVVANEIADIGAGGQICVTKRVAEWLASNSTSMERGFAVTLVGQQRLSQMQLIMGVYQVIPDGLEARGAEFGQHWRMRCESIKINE